jgi:hypothetical protein
MEVISA